MARILREPALVRVYVFVRTSVVILEPMPTHCAVVTPQEGPACKLLSNNRPGRKYSKQNIPVIFYSKPKVQSSSVRSLLDRIFIPFQLMSPET